ncbi:S24 family peptidase [Brevundimonas nasdae]|uniref:Helix-turn-helix transcriptional regulator n=1 Tax=Brevundimonas nasdae TaxID=172043 RepID=A0ABX8TIF8_9CAUL|nr:S24 family peptidase [Brevundimonas nasdae]QYC10587.1 helix-turn-helix transcriptional regulator [Brevundimonas nasdae]QYC13374.1 helix-turn-helix transcriptional regulator [Brevundimonas nasdae]
MKPEEIRSRLRATGRSQAALGRHIGASKDSMSRLMTGQRRLQAVEVERIKEFFAEDAPAGPAYDTLDVYGYVQAGGDDLVSLADGQVIDRIEVPAGLVRGSAIGIRVVGDSMEPRLFSGETVIVGLNMPPQRDRDCVVEFRDGSAIVKQYKGQRDGTVFLHQYNPDKEVRIDASKVKAIHAVLYRR